MKRIAPLGILLAALSLPVVAQAHTSVGISVNLGNAPPPPAIVFRSEPRMVVVPNSTVYVVEDETADCDMFQYGVYWYAFNDGYWYRARSYRGPFRVVGPRFVPAAVVNVPPRWWRHPHGGPPGQMKKYGEWSERDHDRGRHHGHDRDGDEDHGHGR